MGLKTTYETGRVTRYHTNPRMALLNQTNADHAWGVVAIIFYLHPEASMRLIKAATFHDSGELFAGDLPYPFKVDNPQIAREHDAAEKRHARANGVPGLDISLTDEEKKWLHLADRLETVLFSSIYQPEIALKTAWQIQGEMIRDLARDLGCLNQVKELFHAEHS